LLQKFFKKYFIKNCSKINKIHRQELKEAQENQFLQYFIVLDQNDILKKKVPKFAQNC
jgi:hypothetical protein